MSNRATDKEPSPGGLHVLLTGATGLVGSNVLNACLESPEIRQITSLLRRPSGVQHQKLDEVLISDFMDYSGKESLFRNVDLACYCLAVYAGNVSREDYRKITVEYTDVFASALKTHSPGATFCLFSAAGADPTGKSSMRFARVKGAAENVVTAQGFPETYIFRPGYIYPVVKRKEHGFAYRITRALYPVLKALYPAGVVTSVQLGKAIVHKGIHGGDRVVYENRAIRKIGPI